MDKNRGMDERIEQFILNKLSKKESIKFENEIKADPELAKEVELTRHIILAIEQKNEKQAVDEMRNLSRTEVKAILAQEERKPLKKKVYYTLIALVAAALLILYLGVQPTYEGNYLFSKYYVVQVYEAVPTRGTTLNLEQEEKVHEAIKYYKELDYLKASTMFSEFISTCNKNIPDEVLFYYSISLIEIDKTSEAIEYLRHLSSSESIYRKRSQWYLALLLIDKGEKKQAKQLLKGLINDKKGLFSIEAERLLKDLRSKKWFH